MKNITDVKFLSKDYYSFESYNSKVRILTYWYQLSEILSTNSKCAIEIGIGSGFITSYLKHIGIEVKTLDINEELKPDYVSSVLDIRNNKNNIGLYDIVICCRVLHHIEFEKFHLALENLHSITKKHILLSLPVDEARFYFMFRYTSSQIFTFSIKFPLFFKKFYSYLFNKNIGSGLWQINSTSETKLKNINSIINKDFRIIHSYQLPEDKSHCFWLLEKK